LLQPVPTSSEADAALPLNISRPLKKYFKNNQLLPISIPLPLLDRQQNLY